jgi:hypothetical protein
MQFIVPHRDRLPAGALDLAYLTGHEEAPQQTQAQWQGDRLAAVRAEGESATFTIPWIVEGRPPIALSTGTLVERPRPYLLPLELARGTVYRLRSYAFLWQSLGLVLPERLPQLMREATTMLARAATRQDQVPLAAEQADHVLATALEASSLLCAAYAEQSRRARRAMSAQSPLLLGVPLNDRRLPPNEHSQSLLAACNILAIPFTWNTVETAPGVQSWEGCDRLLAWCQERGQRICGGPLVRLDAVALPVWISSATSFQNLQGAVLRHVQAAVERYRGRVQLWNSSAALNTAARLPLSEDLRLRLAASAIETVRAADPQTPVILTLDQPWGEASRDERRQLSPIHFADALVRADLGLGGLGLRINLGFAPDATLPRHAIEISRQIDRWSVFNLPLLLEITLPPGDSGVIRSEREWIEQVVPVLLGKPAVQAIFWGRLFDGDGTRFDDRGLFDAQGAPTPALHAFSTIRRWAESTDA